MTSTFGLEARNVSGNIFRGPCSIRAPFPLAGGTKLVLWRVIGHGLERGPAAATDKPPPGDLEEGPGVLSEVEQSASKKVLLFHYIVGNCTFRDRIVVVTGLS